MDIAQQVPKQPAPHVVVAIVGTILTHLTPIPTHRRIQREAVRVVEVVGLAELQNLAGHEQVRQFFIHPLRCRL